MAETLPTRARADVAGPAKPAPAPKHLSREAKRMWKSLNAEWVLGADALPLLRAALEQWDAYQSAREQLATDGLTVKNKETGMVHRHPAHGIGRDALREFRQLFRQLGLEPPREAKP